jgi:hypothetical protein
MRRVRTHPPYRRGSMGHRPGHGADLIGSPLLLPVPAAACERVAGVSPATGLKKTLGALGVDSERDLRVCELRWVAVSC